eukprot:TRINITY_DN31737_c0_g1_i1.p1 TRINITY_DN31737_c0_g1~~TRINITY_DN31737_c0_g1_i1.p1  ORF type:complete len:164 (-),score=40.63 TRINITY_DN31737_c0_g1_i1:111-578(-)
MVQIQVLQKPQVVDVEDVQDVPQVMEPASYTTLQIRERVDKRKMSSLRSLVMVGTALMVLALVSRTVWMRQFWSKDGLEGRIQLVEIVPEGFGHEVDLSVTCTYDNGAAPWTKDCSCSGIFHCSCVMEITECMKAGGCAEICFRKQEVEVLEIVY